MADPLGRTNAATCSDRDPTFENPAYSASRRQMLNRKKTEDDNPMDMESPVGKLTSGEYDQAPSWMGHAESGYSGFSQQTTEQSEWDWDNEQSEWGNNEESNNMYEEFYG